MVQKRIWWWCTDGYASSLHPSYLHRDSPSPDRPNQSINRNVYLWFDSRRGTVMVTDLCGCDRRRGWNEWMVLGGFLGGDGNG